MYPKLVLTACSVVFFVGILSQFGASFILDDAFIFVRYAGNLIADARMTWNPGGETTYGITSSLFLSIVVPLQLFLPGQPAVNAGLSSLLCGILLLALLALLFLRYTDAGRDIRRLLTVLAFCSLASSIYYLAGHFTGGMDTTFAAAFSASVKLRASAQACSFSFFFRSGVKIQPMDTGRPFAILWAGLGLTIPTRSVSSQKSLLNC